MCVNVAGLVRNPHLSVAGGQNPRPGQRESGAGIGIASSRFVHLGRHVWGGPRLRIDMKFKRNLWSGHGRARRDTRDCFGLLAVTLSLQALGVGLVQASPLLRLGRDVDFGRATEPVPTQVRATVRKLTRVLMTLDTTEGDVIVATPDHPFAKVGAGWTLAADLRAGDRIATVQAGRSAQIRRIVSRPVPSRAVFNLSVESVRAYFVGREGLLVHNGGKCGRPEGPVNDQAGRRRYRSNCTYCSLAAVTGQSVSQLARDKGLRQDHRMGMLPDELVADAERLGLRTHDSTPVRRSTAPDAAWYARDYELHTVENTFLVVYSRASDGFAHSVTAVRTTDEQGRPHVEYIDFQDVPATRSSELPEGVDSVQVIPIDTDWRQVPTIVKALWSP